MRLSESPTVCSQRIIACQSTIENLGLFYPQQKETLNAIYQVLSTLSDKEAIFITIVCCEMLWDQIKSHILPNKEINEKQENVSLNLTNSYLNPFESLYGRWWMSPGIPISFSKKILEKAVVITKEKWMAGEKSISRDMEGDVKKLQKIPFGHFVSMKSILSNSFHEWKPSTFVDHGLIRQIHLHPRRGMNKINVNLFPQINDISEVFEVTKFLNSSTPQMLAFNSWIENSESLDNRNQLLLIPVNNDIGLILTVKGGSPIILSSEAPTLYEILDLCLSSGVAFPIDISEPWMIWKLAGNSSLSSDELVFSMETRKKLLPIFQKWSKDFIPKNTAEKQHQRYFYKFLHQMDSDKIDWANKLKWIQERTRAHFEHLFWQPEYSSEPILTRSGLAANKIATALAISCLEKIGVVLPSIDDSEFYYENINISGFISENGSSQRFSVADTNWWDIVCMYIKNNESEIWEILKKREELGNIKFLIIDITKHPTVSLGAVFKYCESKNIRIITTSSLTKFQRGGTKYFYGILNCYWFSTEELSSCRKLIDLNGSGITSESVPYLQRLNKSELERGQEIVTKQKEVFLQGLLGLNSKTFLVENIDNMWSIFFPRTWKKIFIEQDNYSISLSFPTLTMYGEYYYKVLPLQEQFIERCHSLGFDSRDSFWLEHTQVQHLTPDLQKFRISFGIKDSKPDQLIKLLDLIKELIESYGDIKGECT